MGLAAQGFCTFAPTQQSRAWAQAAYTRAAVILRDAPHAAFRHGSTWFVGVDALPNAPDGSLDGVALAGPWQAHIAAPGHWHRAQLSVVFPGYPQQDANESEAAHRFRTLRFGAHIDGLLPEGPQKRRFLREPHGFILGIALDNSQNAPLMVWPGSHLVMGAAFRAAMRGATPSEVDITEAYGAARRQVFDTIAPRPVHLPAGGAVLLHRHCLHGIAPWGDATHAPQDADLPSSDLPSSDLPGVGPCRAMAYFRPQLAQPAAWLGA